MPTREAPELAALLLEAARASGATVADALPQLTGARFNTEVLSEAISGEGLSRHEGDLPQRGASALLDGMPVLFGAITGSPLKGRLNPQLRRSCNPAPITRCWLRS